MWLRLHVKAGIPIAVTGLMLGLFLGMLDTTIMSAALPTIVGDLGGLAHLSWVITAYSLGAAVTTPIWGKLGDLYGRKRMFMVSIVVFLAGSALAGLSQNMPQLISFRLLQGVGAGGLMVGAIATLGDLVTPRERSRYQALIGTMSPVSFIGGPLLGGYLTDQLSWRWAFYVNLPIGAVALLIAGLGMHLPHRRIHARIDFLGAALLGTVVVTVILVATWGGAQYAWRSPQILALAATGAGALAGFIVTERRVAEPLLPLRLFRDRNFAVAQTLALLVGAAMLSVMSFLPQYMQYVQGASATTSGLLLLPMMAGMVVVLLAAGQVTHRTGRYRMFPITGGAVLTAGMLILLVLDIDTGMATSSALTAVVGIGMGFIAQKIILIAHNSVESRDLGAATGSVTLFRTLGGSLGVALLGSVYTRVLDSTLTERLGAAGHALISGHTRLPPAALTDLPAPARAAVKAAVTLGVHGVLIGGAALAATVFVISWLIREVPLRGPDS